MNIKLSVILLVALPAFLFGMKADLNHSALAQDVALSKNTSLEKAEQLRLAVMDYIVGNDRVAFQKIKTLLKGGADPDYKLTANVALKINISCNQFLEQQKNTLLLVRSAPDQRAAIDYISESAKFAGADAAQIKKLEADWLQMLENNCLNRIEDVKQLIVKYQQKPSESKKAKAKKSGSKNSVTKKNQNKKRNAKLKKFEEEIKASNLCSDRKQAILVSLESMPPDNPRVIALKKALTTNEISVKEQITALTETEAEPSHEDLANDPRWQKEDGKLIFIPFQVGLDEEEQIPDSHVAVLSPTAQERDDKKSERGATDEQKASQDNALPETGVGESALRTAEIKSVDAITSQKEATDRAVQVAEINKIDKPGAEQSWAPWLKRGAVGLLGIAAVIVGKKLYDGYNQKDGNL